MKVRVLLVISCCVVVLAWTCQASSSSTGAGHHRSLLAWPIPLPAPFDFPVHVAESARTAKKAGKFAAYAKQMCTLLADPKLQGKREFMIFDTPLWPMASNVARAAYGYSKDVSDLWGEVFVTCNSLSPMSQQGAGYAVAFVYVEGLVDSIGMTKILESAYNQGQQKYNGDGCKAVDNILDVAAAAIKARGTGKDELHAVMGTYSKTLQECTPKDADQRFKPQALKRDMAASRIPTANAGRR